MSKIFKTLFIFCNETSILIEVGRVDIESEDKSKIYFWLIVDRNNLQVTRLNFRSMSQGENGENKREFEQGSLTFNTERAIFNGEQFQSTNGDSIPQEVSNAIEKYLLAG